MSVRSHRDRPFSKKVEIMEKPYEFTFDLATLRKVPKSVPTRQFHQLRKLRLNKIIVTSQISGIMQSINLENLEIS